MFHIIRSDVPAWTSSTLFGRPRGDLRRALEKIRDVADDDDVERWWLAGQSLDLRAAVDVAIDVIDSIGLDSMS